MNTIIDRIQKLKDDAGTSRNLEEYQASLDTLDKAIGLVDPATEDKDLKAHLADCYGMKGGVFRRMSDFESALRMYKEGLAHEETLGVDSYNLSNVVALSVMLDPNSLVGLQRMIAAGIGRLKSQEQKRQGQWWYWADRGMLCILCFECAEDSLAHYKKFQDAGAQSKDFESAQDVLIHMRNSLDQISSPIARKLSPAIEFLTEERPE